MARRPLTTPTLADVARFDRLIAAARRASRGKPCTPARDRFLAEIEPECLHLERELLTEVWRPGPARHFVIRQPKRRVISAAPFADRVVHHALCAAIEPALERFAIDDSYACRPGRGIRRALRRLQHFTRRRAYAMRLDIARCFPSIGHARVLDRLHRRFADPGLLRLLGRIVEVPQPGCAPGHGLPIGSLTSQHLANFYLGHLDRYAVQGLGAGPWLRYMDDMVCLADDKPSLWSIRDGLALFAEHALGLSLKPSATRVMPVSDGVPFLGFRVFPGTIRLGPRAVRRWRRSMRGLQRAVDAGWLDEDDAARRAASLLGWADHADTRSLRTSVFGGRA